MDVVAEPPETDTPPATLHACTDDEWTELVQWVRDYVRLPQRHRVTFRRADAAETPGLEGWAHKPSPRHFEVVVVREITRDHTVLVLLHEVAHVLDWNDHYPWRDDHPPTFWVHLGALYNAFHQGR